MSSQLSPRIFLRNGVTLSLDPPECGIYIGEAGGKPAGVGDYGFQSVASLGSVLVDKLRACRFNRPPMPVAPGSETDCRICLYSALFQEGLEALELV
jgi:hypothetical protein